MLEFHRAHAQATQATDTLGNWSELVGTSRGVATAEELSIDRSNGMDPYAAATCNFLQPTNPPTFQAHSSFDCADLAGLCPEAISHEHLTHEWDDMLDSMAWEEADVMGHGFDMG